MKTISQQFVDYDELASLRAIFESTDKKSDSLWPNYNRFYNAFEKALTAAVTSGDLKELENFGVPSLLPSKNDPEAKRSNPLKKKFARKMADLLKIEEKAKKKQAFAQTIKSPVKQVTA